MTDERPRARPIQVPRPERQIAFRTGISAESRAAAAAEAWLARNGDDRIRDIRFDAMLVAPGRIPRHIPAAFDASVPIPKFANPRGTL